MRKRFSPWWLLLAAVLAVLALARTRTDQAGAPAGAERSATGGYAVVRVIDGDTFVVDYNGRRETVRIAVIDAPEMDTPGGPPARDALTELIGGRTVQLEIDARRPREHYGRLLARVRVDGLDVGDEMIRRGQAGLYHHRRRK